MNEKKYTKIWNKPETDVISALLRRLGLKSHSKSKASKILSKSKGREQK